MSFGECLLFLVKYPYRETLEIIFVGFVIQGYFGWVCGVVGCLGVGGMIGMDVCHIGLLFIFTRKPFKRYS
jgi:hypothetical protein